MNIQDYFKYSWFSNLAYVDYPSGSSTTPGQAITLADFAKRIPGASGGLVDTLGELIFIQQGWRIASFQPNDAAGFAATLFTNGTEKILAIRGTEPESVADLLQADLAEIGTEGMAISQAVSLFNYIQRLMAKTTDSDVLQLTLHRTPRDQLSPLPPTENYVIKRS